jgi:hypothetical protein
VGGLSPGDNAGTLFAGATGVREMEHRQPISKSEYLAAMALIAAAIGILAIIAVLIFATP